MSVDELSEFNLRVAIKAVGLVSEHEHERMEWSNSILTKAKRTTCAQSSCIIEIKRWTLIDIGINQATLLW